MFKDTRAYSGFSVNDLQKAKAFYGQTLGLQVSEAGGNLELQVDLADSASEATSSTAS